ncbi:hypothetical protein Tco_0385635 [Tanacetum coccineum]
MIVDIEDDIMDPVMQCTTLPSHSGFSQKKLVSFVTEIHTLSIDISLRDCLDDDVATIFIFLLLTVLFQDKTTVLQPHSSEVGFINHMLILKLSKAQVDQGSQIKMNQVKEMMQDNDLKNSKSKDKGSKSRSQSMNEQSRYKQDKTKTRQSINVKSHVFNVKGDNDKSKQTPTRMSSVVRSSLKEETSTLGEIVSLNYIKSNKNVIGLRKSN